MENQLILLEDLGMIYPKETSKVKRHYAIYKCYCGNKFKARIDGVKNGNTTSCGCYHLKTIKEVSTKHGLLNHKLHHTWNNFKQRCSNPNNPKYKDYGEINIKVCDEWKNDFISFYTWAINNGYKQGLSIDRINNNLGYSPDNCRWVNKEIQQRNKRILMSTNTSGYKGVCFKNGKFVASIYYNNKNHHLGRFKTAIEAAKAYDYHILYNNLEHTINGVTI